MSETPQTSPSSLPSENVPRGTILALLIIPAGIVVWVILWSFGFIASIVALGVALGALALYRLGSGGRISRSGAIRVTIITIVTLLLSFAAGVVSEAPAAFARALDQGRFLQALFGVLLTPDFAIQFLLALGLGALGCFSVLRTAFVQTAAVNSQATQGVQPGVAPTLYPNAPAVPAPGTDAAPPSPSAEASPGADPEKRD